MERPPYACLKPKRKRGSRQAAPLIHPLNFAPHKGRAMLPEKHHPEQPGGTNLAEFETVTLKPYFECTRHGVFYIAVESDKEGNITEKPPMRLSDAVHLIGRGIDASGAHYRVIEWHDSLSRQKHTAALPMAEIGTNWARLQGLGIAVMASRRKRELLTDYLQTDGQQTPYTVTAQSGWTAAYRAYVLPSGEVLAASDAATSKATPRVIYNGDKSQASAYTPAGSLEDWQQHIGRHLAGNSRLCLAVGASLAAPLLGLLGMEAGGFHLFGDSRDGKSTAARLALSVWGDPAALLDTWTGTAHGFANRANARNDGLLVLDEIGQANPRHVSQTAYSVINGVAKIQGAKEGGNREAPRWKVMLLSTGEKPMDSFLEHARADWNAGQAARLPSIPSDAGHGFGIFDTLHGHHKGSTFSEALNEAARQHHGQAGRAFIRLLLDTPTAASEARALQAAFMQTLPETDGQTRTVAARFATVAAALELAARYGITGLAEGLAFPAIKQCFDAWLERAGVGKFEDRKIIKQAKDFMQLNARGMRFSDWNSQHQTTNSEHAGYRKPAGQAEHDEYWIIPAVFEGEICQTFEAAKACAVLHGIQWLKKSETENRWKHKRKGYGRFYVLVGIEPPESDED